MNLDERKKDIHEHRDIFSDLRQRQHLLSLLEPFFGSIFRPLFATLSHLVSGTITV